MKASIFLSVLLACSQAIAGDFILFVPDTKHEAYRQLKEAGVSFERQINGELFLHKSDIKRIEICDGIVSISTSEKEFTAVIEKEFLKVLRKILFSRDESSSETAGEKYLVASGMVYCSMLAEGTPKKK